MNLQQAKEYTAKLFTTKWVKWVHKGTNHAKNNLEKMTNVIKGENSKHCARCLNLNGCCFVEEKCPVKPLHPNCHCYTVYIPHVEIKAECFIEKFTKYVFISSTKNDKKQLFESWGYGIMDAEYLQQEFIKQAKLGYSVGDYELGQLNDFGQKISVK